MQTQTIGIKRKRKRISFSDAAFHTINYTLLAVLTFACLFPFLNTFSSAFSSNHAIQAGKVLIWPVEPHLDAIKAVMLDSNIIRAMGVTVYITIFGTLLNMIATVLTAYPLSRRDLKYRGHFMNYMIFTMMFSGGMIPGYLLIKTLGMLNTYWVLMIPGLVSAFNVIIMKTFFQNMPDELRDAAIVDGCSNFRYLLTVVLPLSGAVLATIGLFYAVGHWNTYSAALIYNDDPKYWTLQVKLRNILLLSQMDTSLETMQTDTKLHVIAESLKAAVIVVATVPILIVYPFLQKYFVKGAMLGSVKG
jgi:ABC-type glycerol-3-phosphate transport system permease component